MRYRRDPPLLAKLPLGVLFVGALLAGVALTRPDSSGPQASPQAEPRAGGVARSPDAQPGTQTIRSAPSWERLDFLPLQGMRARETVESPAEQAPTVSWTRITFYNCVPDGYCGSTFSGVQVGPGHAACDAARLGWRFRIRGDPEGRTYVCTDTGNQVWGDHVDVWHYRATEGWAWQSAVGEYALVEWKPRR